MRRVEVVRVRRVFSSQSIDTFDEGGDAKGLAVSADDVLRRADEVSNLTIGEARAFSPLHEFVVYFFNGANYLDSPARLDDIVYSVEVPLETDVNTVTLCRQQTPYLVDLRLSSNVRPIAMTSPTLFIEDPTSRLTVVVVLATAQG